MKRHGGKSYLAKRIVALMPPRRSPKNPDGWLHFVEPYFGGGAVLLENNPEGISEVVNDLDAALITFWRVLQDERLFERFKRRVEAIPFSQSEFDRAYFVTTVTHPVNEQDWLDVAVAFFVRCRMSMTGRMKTFCPTTKTRVRRGMNGDVSAWLSAVEGLPAVHERLKRVQIVGPKPALEVIRQQDSTATLYYADPPYLHESRVSTNAYAHEMSSADHLALLKTLAGIKGRFILSGYPSAMNEEAIQENGWYRTDISIPNHSAGGATKRRMTEILVTNYEPPG
jgi:DNA adenine methylase